MRPVAEILAEVRHAAATGRREVQLLGQIVNHYQAPDRADVDFAGAPRAGARGRGHRAHPLREPASAPLHAAHDRRDPRPAEGLQAPPHAGAVGLDDDPEGDAPPLHARGVPRSRRVDPRDDSRRRAVDRHDRRASRARREADFDETLSLTREVRFPQHVLVQVFAAPAHAGRPALRRRRVRAGEDAAASSRCSSCSGTIQSEILEEMVGKAYEVLIDGPSRRRPDEWAGRTDGNTIVNFAWPDGASRAPATCSAPSSGPVSTEAGRQRRSKERHADRDDHQGPDDRPGHQHAHHRAARQGRDAGPRDLGRRLRGQRDRRADREHGRRPGR